MDEVLSALATAESAHTSSRKSARSARVEIITRGERRRSWSVEQKREIVAESLGPELSPAEVARKHAIGSGQLYTWRRQFLKVQSCTVTRQTPPFAEVELAPASSRPADFATMAAPLAHSPAMAPRPDGLIEMLLPGDVVVRVDAHVDGRALRRVLEAVQGR
jgi:transposase